MGSPGRSLVDVSAGTRPGRVVELRPGASDVSLLDARGDSSVAQTVTAQLSVAYAFGSRADGTLNWPDGFSPFLQCTAEWGTDGGSTRCVFDLTQGAAITVVASFLRLSASYPRAVPNRAAATYGDADPTNPLHTVRVSASLGLYGRAVQGGAPSATYTQNLPTLTEGSVIVAVPTWARSVNLFGTGVSLLRGRWLYNPTAAPLAEAVWSPTEANGERSWGISGGAWQAPAGANLFQLENLTDEPATVSLLWQLAI